MQSRNKQQHNLKNNTWTDNNSINISKINNNEDKIWGDIDENSVILCNCNENAIQLIVRKEGPNHGINLNVYKFLFKFYFKSYFSLNTIYYNRIISFLQL